MFRARIFRGNSGPAQNMASRLDETQNFASRLDETTGFGRCVPSLLEGCLTENHSENFFRLRDVRYCRFLAADTTDVLSAAMAKCDGAWGTVFSAF